MDTWSADNATLFVPVDVTTVPAPIITPDLVPDIKTEFAPAVKVPAPVVNKPSSILAKI